MRVRPDPQIIQSGARLVDRPGFDRMTNCFSSYTTSESGGTLFIKKTFAPIVEFAPTTVAPPRIVEFG